MNMEIMPEHHLRSHNELELVNQAASFVTVFGHTCVLRTVQLVLGSNHEHGLVGVLRQAAN